MERKEPQEFELISMNELEVMLRISRSTIYRRLKDGSLPRPLRIGGLVFWRKSDICAWVDGLVS